MQLVSGEGARAKTHFVILDAVGVCEHDRFRALGHAEADVTELAAVLRKAGYEVTLLTGGSADEGLRPTRANVERHLHDVLRRCRAGDTVLVALAGHGLQFEGQADAFFCPIDARPFRDETGTLVSLGKVYAEMEKSFAGMKVLLVAACRDDPGAARGARGITADAAPRPPQGVAALFSCRAGECAYESDKLGHGVFFYHVLEGLRGKAKDADNEVTFAGLAAYVSRRVAREVPKLVGADARQSPNLKADYSTEPVLVSLRDAGRPGTDDRAEIKEGGTSSSSCAASSGPSNSCNKTRPSPWRWSLRAPASRTRAISAVTSSASSASRRGSSGRPQESPNRPQVSPRNSRAPSYHSP
jgi:hypothetical protein